MAKTFQVVDLFYDLKVEFNTQFPRVEERTVANLEKLRNRIDSEPPESLHESLRDQFLMGIDVMLSMAQKPATGSGDHSTGEYIEDKVPIRKGYV